MSQVETNKSIIKLYFEAYNTKNEAIFDEIIAPDYIDHGQSYYLDSPGRGARNDLKNSLDKLDDFTYVIEAMIASESVPDLVGTYWKGSLTPKASPHDAPHINKIINYRGVSIYRIQNGKMIETWHVIDGLPEKHI
jgi:predicted ester cyclase